MSENLAISNENKENSAAPVGNGKSLRKKDLVKHWFLGYSSETCYNYERLQALGCTNAMVPIVRRLYDKKEDQIRKYICGWQRK